MGNNGRFSDGLFFGALIGGAAVFLLGTKKGNKVLKVLTQEGIAGFNEIMEEIEDYREDLREEKDLEFIEEDDEVGVVVETAKVPAENVVHQVPKSKSSSKRFFRKK